MKFIHLSDLHIGKRVNDFSLIEDQKYILQQILKITDREKPDAVLIAGDVYDKAVPTAEAVELLDSFLSRLSERNLPVFIISGNHDSPERLAFGSSIMSRGGIHFSRVYNGEVEKYSLEDEYGMVNIFMLPFIKPSNVRRFYPEEEIGSYTQAVAVALKDIKLDNGQRNIIMTHQFVTGARRSDSEEISVGGSDNVDAAVFDGFDYVALGHIHGPQSMTKPTVRYCGTPLKYSFSEAGHKKSVTVVTMTEKSNVQIDTIELVPLRDMRNIKGTYMEIADRNNYIKTNINDYIHITLTDEEDVPDAIGRLRSIYPNIMKLDYDNARTRTAGEFLRPKQAESKSPARLFADFYFMQNNRQMSDDAGCFAHELIEKLWEGKV